MKRQAIELDTLKLSPIATCTETNIIAEPVIGSAAKDDVLARVSAIEEKLQSLAKLLSTVEHQATEAVGRSALTNVRVNHVVTRLEASSTTSTRVTAKVWKRLPEANKRTATTFRLIKQEFQTSLLLLRRAVLKQS